MRRVSQAHLKQVFAFGGYRPETLLHVNLLLFPSRIQQGVDFLLLGQNTRKECTEFGRGNVRISR